MVEYNVSKVMTQSLGVQRAVKKFKAMARRAHARRMITVNVDGGQRAAAATGEIESKP